MVSIEESNFEKFFTESEGPVPSEILSLNSLLSVKE